MPTTTPSSGTYASDNAAAHAGTMSGGVPAAPPPDAACESAKEDGPGTPPARAGVGGYRLADSQSPYLHQHSANPVEWYPWGDEAAAAARLRNVPILLSVGYSACHWCHVMAHESFENESTAEQMNRDFVCVKVDREERPDIDAAYQPVAQALTGGGGWPLTVFLTQEFEPFYGGTYFPPAPAFGRAGFPQVLSALSTLWTTDRKRVAELVRDIAEATAEHRVSRAAQRVGPRAESDKAAGSATFEDPGPSWLSGGGLAGEVKVLSSLYDDSWGGMGRAPKFPNAPLLDLLVTVGATGSASATAMLTGTLRHMMAGGICDHLGGGFHRYATDRQWLIPHFEKMLYDNAQLAYTLTNAYLLTGEVAFADAARSSLDYLLRDMRHPEGGFYSSEDADSEGEEGLFYTWTPDEVARALAGTGAADSATAFCRAYGVTESGNLDGRSVLHLRGGPDTHPELAKARHELLAARTARVRPQRDGKVLTGWNGLAIRALARAGSALDSPAYLAAARSACRFLESHLMAGAGLRRSYLTQSSVVPGFLEDYAFVCDGLWEMYQATADPSFLAKCASLCARALEVFWDGDQFADAPAGGDANIWGTALPLQAAAPRPTSRYVDEAVPSGAAVLVRNLLRLAALGVDLPGTDPRRIAGTVVREAIDEAAGNAWGYAALLMAADTSLRGSVEVRIDGTDAVGDQPSAAARLWRAALSWPEHSLVVGVHPGEPRRAAAHVCVDAACQAPIFDPAELSAALRAISARRA